MALRQHVERKSGESEALRMRIERLDGQVTRSPQSCADGDGPALRAKRGGGRNAGPGASRRRFGADHNPRAQLESHESRPATSVAVAWSRHRIGYLKSRVSHADLLWQWRPPIAACRRGASPPAHRGGCNVQARAEASC